MTESKQAFEKAYAELEKIVEELEAGELTIDESVTKFEQGLKIAKQLKTKLADVEKKIESLNASFADSDQQE